MPQIENHFAEVLHSERRYRELLTRWHAESGTKLGYSLIELTKIDGRPLYLLRPAELNDGPRVLVAGAFHGEEPCGAWGILKFLIEDLQRYSSINISFLPLVNPTGLDASTRVNYLGQNPNCGFVAGTKDDLPISTEGQVFVDHLPIISDLAKDGFISLHEDWEQTHTYLYTFESAKTPGRFTNRLLEALSKFFPILQDDSCEGASMRGGVIFNHPDGSFEDLLFRSGTRYAACSETPGAQPAARRIVCNAHVIKEFIGFFVTGDNDVSQGASRTRP